MERRRSGGKKGGERKKWRFEGEEATRGGGEEVEREKETKLILETKGERKCDERARGQCFLYPQCNGTMEGNKRRKSRGNRKEGSKD